MGFVHTRATVKSIQSVLRLKSCGLLKGTEVNSLGAVDNATVNVGKYKSGFKKPPSSQGRVLQYIYIPR